MVSLLRLLCTFFLLLDLIAVIRSDIHSTMTGKRRLPFKSSKVKGKLLQERKNRRQSDVSVGDVGNFYGRHDSTSSSEESDCGNTIDDVLPTFVDIGENDPSVIKVVGDSDVGDGQPIKSSVLVNKKVVARGKKKYGGG